MNPRCYRDGLQLVATLDTLNDEESVFLAKTLVGAGADPSVKTASQVTAYHMAMRHRKSALAQYLLPLAKLTEGTHVPPVPASVRV